MPGGHGSKTHFRSGMHGKGDGTGALTDVPKDMIGDNMVLSNRDKKQHSDIRGMDGNPSRPNNTRTTPRTGSTTLRRPTRPESVPPDNSRTGVQPVRFFVAARSRSHPNTERPSRSGEAASSPAMKASTDGPLAVRSSRRA